MKKILLIIYLLVITSIKAQTPQSFNYQAVARNSDGSVVSNKNVTVKISILQNSTSGNIVFSESHTAITNNIGLLNIAIGTGTLIQGSFTNINWASGIYFLKTEIDPNGGNNFQLSGVSQLLSVPYAMYANNAGNTKWSTNGNNIYNNNNGNVGVGTLNPNSKLEVKGATDTLFQVKDANGNPVFVVFPEGVQVYVKEGATKGNLGGFAVSGRSASKGITGEYFRITPDSARIYIKETPTNKGNLGGFAVSGRSASKNLKNYFNVSVDTSGLINPSQARILWYPTKSAFLTGQVLIQHKDSVGKNSFATGFESKAIGNWSQAMGYKAIARKDYSTAIGNNAIANGIGSFAFGSQGRDTLTMTIGRNTIASGNYSFAIGLGAQASNNSAFAVGQNATASGEFSVALGNSSWSQARLSTALGANSTATANYSTAISSGLASGYSSTAIGYLTKTTGSNAVSIGSGYVYSVSGMSSNVYNHASGSYSITIGNGNNASSYYATAIGYRNYNYGEQSISLGSNLIARSYGSIVLGRYNVDNTGYNTFSWVNTEPLFVVGNGSYGAPSNAITVLKNGSVYFPGAYDDIVGATNNDLYIDNTGKIGHLSSSIRYKNDVTDMENVDWIYKLRPVNYTYKTDEKKIKQYGLIAEEVNKINPLFVSFNKNGEIETVQYSQLITPLLKAVQEQKATIDKHENEIIELKKLIQQQQTLINNLIKQVENKK